jgi:hypothetical protein
MTRARDNSFNPFNNNYAGKNVLINGGMDIWQRNTSFPVTVPGQVLYSADRWTCYAGNTGTISRDTSLVPVGLESSLKFTSNINNSGMDFYQLIETKNVIPLRGKTVTLSAYVAGTNGKVPAITAYYSTTNDDYVYLNSGVAMQVTNAPSGISSSSFQRISTTFTVPVTAATIRIGLVSGTLNNTEFINWSGIQLELGSYVTPFSRSGGDISGELRLCQRYFQRVENNVSTYLSLVVTHLAAFGNSYSQAVLFPVQMRSSVSLSFFDVANNSGKVTAYLSGGTNNVTPTINQSSGSGFRMSVAGEYRYLDFYGTTASAEL